VRIYLAGLKEGSQEFERELSPESIGLGSLDFQVSGPVRVAGWIEKRLEQYIVSGAIRVPVEIPCSRCLAPVETVLEGEFTVLADRRHSRDSDEDLEELQKNRYMVFHDGESFEIGEELREAALLSVPTKVLCREDCKGLCPTCGADLNRESCDCAEVRPDSPWEVLRKLRKHDAEGV